MWEVHKFVHLGSIPTSVPINKLVVFVHLQQSLCARGRVGTLVELILSVSWYSSGDGTLVELVR